MTCSRRYDAQESVPSKLRLIPVTGAKIGHYVGNQRGTQAPKKPFPSGFTLCQLPADTDLFEPIGNNGDETDKSRQSSPIALDHITVREVPHVPSPVGV